MLLVHVVAAHEAARVFGLGGAQNAAVAEGHLAVCAAADPQIVAEAPVVEVVLALVARLGVGRGFVLLIAGGAQQLVAALEDVPQRIVVRQNRRARAEQGVRLDGQLIPRQVRRIEGDSLAQIVQRLFQRLIRQAVHQIEVEAAQAKIGRQRRRTFGFFRAVDAPQTVQLLGAEALHPDGDAVDAGALVAAEAIGLHGAGIGFHGDFGVVGDANARPHAVQQGLHCLGAQQAGGAAADKDSADFPAAGQRQVGIQIRQQMIDILLMRHVTLQRMGVEIAVRAFLHAPRDVDVETQRGQLKHCAWLPTSASAPCRGAKSPASRRGSARRRCGPAPARRRPDRNRNRLHRRPVR
ncbi:Uncharacterised protein [Acinetobacter baumannii]|nr:Uncharacterised protein [Acinetobacter baumannii]